MSILGIVLLSAPIGTALAEDGERPDAARPVLAPSPAFRGKRVDILDGEIPVSEFLRFLADYTGLAVMLDNGGPKGLDENITIAAPIRNADGDTVRAILEANGWRVTKNRLPNGQTVLDVGVIEKPEKSGSFISLSDPNVRIYGLGAIVLFAGVGLAAVVLASRARRRRGGES